MLTLEMISLSAEPTVNAISSAPTRTLFNMIVDDSADIGAADTMESFDDLVEESDLEEVDLADIEEAAAQQEAGYDLAIGKKVRQTLAEIKDKNYYEVFKLRQGEFSFDKLKKKYFSYTHEFGPELLMQLSGEEASLVEEILSLVTNAYNTLSDVVKKERYDELLGSSSVGLGEKGDDKFQAQVQSQSGKVFIEMEEWDNAINALQDAVNIVPSSGDYLAHLGWAIYRNPANERSTAMRDRAKQMINKSLILDRTAAGHSFKGWLLFEAGRESLAESEFSKALRIDARNILARQGMRKLQEKREQDKKGLFRKMFR
jgi:tetratricopeptide (TPR) repeat protein